MAGAWGRNIEELQHESSSPDRDLNSVVPNTKQGHRSLDIDGRSCGPSLDSPVCASWGRLCSWRRGRTRRPETDPPQACVTTQMLDKRDDGWFYKLMAAPITSPWGMQPTQLHT
jgi:hypothetical protein